MTAKYSVAVIILLLLFLQSLLWRLFYGILQSYFFLYNNKIWTLFYGIINLHLRQLFSKVAKHFDPKLIG